MKLKSTLLIICASVSLQACMSQTKQEAQNKAMDTENRKSDSGKSMNLLDEQVRILDQVFALGGSGDENPFGGATNYLELIDQLEGSEELKEQARKTYDLYNTSLDPNQKEKLKLKINKMLEEAISKSQSDQ